MIKETFDKPPLDRLHIDETIESWVKKKKVIMGGDEGKAIDVGKASNGTGTKQS